ncbi:MAG: ExsB family protein [Pseudothermotoga sp.]|nr:ExsB family protein [Pseudothermotoga sp.]
MWSNAHGQLQKIVDHLICEIKDVVSNREVVVAFSGGEDSSLAAYLCKLAVGPGRVILATVDWGQFTYQVIKDNINRLATDLGLRHVYLDGTKRQRNVWKYGPNCNGCTRFAKLGTVRENFPDQLIVTGSNQSDSWGRFGPKILAGFYSPLKELSKSEIRQLISFFQIEPVKIGESSVREGCKLKHLMKMLINPDYHGKAVSEANELLLKFLRYKGKSVKLANVKIIGPLSKNIALVNVYPHLEDVEKQEIFLTLKDLNVIDEIYVLDRAVRLKILVNPGLYNDPSALEDIFTGFIERDFAVPVSVVWIKARNNRLRTFQVVDFEYE